MTFQVTIDSTIRAWHDSEARKLLAPSWGAYLESLAKSMEDGLLIYSEDEGLICE